MNSKVTRRTFIKTAPQAAGIAAAAGITWKQTLAAGAHAAGDETIKIALIGCGSRGTGAASQALQTKGPVKLWAMADLFADRLESSLANLSKGEKGDYDREAHGGLQSQIDVPPERRFVGFDAYEKAIDSGVDLVILATHPHFRPTHYEYAVRQGKHVFMEKPVAVDAPGIRQILAANDQAKQKNLKVVVGLMHRHNLRIQETVKRLQAGQAGAISLMRSYWCTGTLRDTPPRPPHITEMEYQLRNPYHFVWQSGDYIVDALLHNIDAACWLKGEHPTAAQGQGGRSIISANQSGDIFDHHFVEFTFPDESKMFAQAREIAGCWNNTGAYFHGTLGSSEVGRGAIDGKKPWRFRGNVPNPYQVEHDVLMEAIRRNEAHNEVDYAATSTMTAIMGRMATYSGQMVDWNTAFNSKLRLGPDKYAFDAPAPVVADASGVYPVAIPGITKVF
jgi:myo-inositol 2-dehydrogenase / D-chiro-inositol 1-dehydrogenase